MGGNKKTSGYVIKDPYLEEINRTRQQQIANTSKLKAQVDVEEIRSAILVERSKETSEWSKYYYEQEKNMTGAASGAANTNQTGTVAEEKSSGQEEIGANEQEVEAAMQESQMTISAVTYEYLVRGAMLRCTCGSHYRRLNLPQSHNYYKEGRPLMNELDSIPGTKDKCESAFKNRLNVPYFGVCTGGNSPGETILLKADKTRDHEGKVVNDGTEKKKSGKKDGNFKEKFMYYAVERDENVKGPVCMAKIMSTWLCPDEKCQVDGRAAIRTDSFLVCEYGGIIEVVNSGQKYEDNIEEAQLK